MSLAVNENQHTTAPSFTEETSRIVGRLKNSLKAIFAQVPGGIRNSYDGHRYFGIDTKLSWQLFKISVAEDELSLAPYVPSPTSMQKFMKAARERGVVGEMIDATGNTYAEFERLVEVHAGDRTRFNSMVRGLSGDQDDPNLDVRHRKAVFAGHSHFWGVQIETYTVSFIICPGSQADRYDYAHIRSKSGICRLRADTPIILDTLKMTDTRGGGDTIHRSPLVQSDRENNVAGVISHFSSHPLPKLATERLPDGRTTTRLTGDEVGRKNRVNVAFGHIWRNAPISPWLDTNRDGFGTAVKVTYPTALLVVDVLAHRKAFKQLEQHSAVYGHASQDGDVGDIMRYKMELPFRERIAKLATSKQNLAIDEVPEYRELIRYSFDQTHWDLEDFDLYRLSIQYPLMDTLVSAWFHTDDAGKRTFAADWQI